MPSDLIVLNNAQLQKLSAGIAALDGVRTSADLFETFKFNSDTTWNLALNHTLIQGKLGPYEAARKSLAKQYGIGITDKMAITTENADAVKLFIDALEDLQGKVVQVEGLIKIKRGDLNVGNGKGENNIAVSVLTNLMPILE